MTEPTPPNKYSGLSEEVGASLAQRRQELGASLRAIAAAAQVSPSHLSEIENGRSQVSLPVLLRLVTALDLTITDLLPRIGGRRVRTGSLRDVEQGITRLSHDKLELALDHCQLGPGEQIELDNPTLDDFLIHVLSGEATIDAAGERYDLRAGDTMDSERLAGVVVTTTTAATILTAYRADQP